MASSASTTTVASCPGKVLVLGGYCILERPNSGLVIAVSSRFTCEATWIDDDVKTSRPNRVKVYSRQWAGWKGSYSFEHEKGLVPDKDSPDRNAYVEKPVAWILACMLKQHSFPKGKALQLTLLADNDFYSQQENLKLKGLERTSEGLRSLAPYSDVKNKSAKTGLGSSAAMISAITSCILTHFGIDNIEYAHRLAQLCHAAVQGKIGSGFDVCTAFYGSMCYVRYSPEPLSDCLSVLATNGSFAIATQALDDCAKDESKWNHTISKCSLPPGIELLCADVAGGSETPSMSKKILDYKAKSD